MEHRHLKVEQKGMQKGKPPEPLIVVIFGASGDLAHHELLPSLYALKQKKLLPDKFAIIGFAMEKWSDDEYREEMHGMVKKLDEYDEKTWKEFAGMVYYTPGEFDDATLKTYESLKKKIQQVQKQNEIKDNILFHLSAPPDFYSTIIQKLSTSKLAKSNEGWRRVIIEKPFGEDEKSARELDKEIHKVFEEHQIFRIDHFLGKETVQNMLVFRFANPGFEPIWNRNYIDNIQITVAEDIGIRKRGAFYEKTGVLRDMVQNHLFQLMCMAAIEPPVNFDAHSLRTETVKVLDSVCQINQERDVVLGQYDSGTVDGKKANAYRDEDKVNKDSNAPTYAAIRIFLDNWRWAGVPFYLRTGKRLEQKLTEVTIRFKPTPHLMFQTNKREERKHNILTFRLQPNEGIFYSFTAKRPGADLTLQPVNLIFNYNEAFEIKETPSSYQWLLHDAMQGDQTLFPRAEWIYKSWSIIDPIIKEWENKPWSVFPNYKAGSWGPEDADDMLRLDKRKWFIQ
ncbi:glucose-6-phosphate dehydrogenase [bacterium BMS3Abin03]|jgi:glucose-6-phosphate 1-dehydrogenase|nr:glucose-6-phosphate dehydrogenase [bacterium BMS3Abin03]MCG6958270.1 glucose-6-phosphate dehydrogenase [bacterium BMS3Abin03]